LHWASALVLCGARVSGGPKRTNMGSARKSLGSWLPLTVWLAATASCGIFPGRDFGGSLGSANDSTESPDTPDSGGISTAGSGGSEGEGEREGEGEGESGGTADGDASPVGAQARDSDTESAFDSGGDSQKGIDSAGGFGSTVQIRSGAFTGLAGAGRSVGVGAVRVFGQFTSYGASSAELTSRIVVQGGFE
jgi:hypothetical protein